MENKGKRKFLKHVHKYCHIGIGKHFQQNHVGFQNTYLQRNPSQTEKKSSHKIRPVRHSLLYKLPYGNIRSCNNIDEDSLNRCWKFIPIMSPSPTATSVPVMHCGLYGHRQGDTTGLSFYSFVFSMIISGGELILDIVSVFLHIQYFSKFLRFFRSNCDQGNIF